MENIDGFLNSAKFIGVVFVNHTQQLIRGALAPIQKSFHPWMGRARIGGNLKKKAGYSITDLFC